MRPIHDFMERPSSTTGEFVRVASVCKKSRISLAIEPYGTPTSCPPRLRPDSTIRVVRCPSLLQTRSPNAFVRQRRHGEAGVCDAESTFLLSKERRGCVDSTAIG